MYPSSHCTIQVRRGDGEGGRGKEKGASGAQQGGQHFFVDAEREKALAGQEPCSMRTVFILGGKGDAEKRARSNPTIENTKNVGILHIGNLLYLRCFRAI